MYSTCGLQTAVKMWPTPVATDGTHGGRVTPRKGREGGNLVEAVSARMYPTPTAHNAKEVAAPSEYLRNTPTLAATVGGHLNPDWVEWLMGWPIGWTDLDNDDPGVHGFESEPPNVPRTTTVKTRRGKRLKAIGNGQVPQCAAMAWRLLADS